MMDVMIHGMGRIGCRETCAFSSRGEEEGEERDTEGRAHLVCMFLCVIFGFLPLVLF